MRRAQINNITINVAIKQNKIETIGFKERNKYRLYVYVVDWNVNEIQEV